MGNYYFNPNTDEVHRRGACSFQDTIDDWEHLGRFNNLNDAVARARSQGHRSANRCEHCYDTESGQ